AARDDPCRRDPVQYLLVDPEVQRALLRAHPPPPRVFPGGVPRVVVELMERTDRMHPVLLRGPPRDAVERAQKPASSLALRPGGGLRGLEDRDSTLPRQVGHPEVQRPGGPRRKIHGKTADGGKVADVADLALLAVRGEADLEGVLVRGQVEPD